MALLVPTAPLLSASLASRGDDSATAQTIRELHVKADWAGLSKFARERIARNPEDGDWWVVLGYATMQLKDFSGAVQVLSTAAERSPEDIDALNLLAEAQRLSGQLARATRTLDRAVTVSPGSPVSRFLLGEVYRDDGRLERAREAYFQAVEIEPEFILAWHGLVKVLARVGTGEDYELALGRLRKLDPVLAQEFPANKAAK